MLIDDVDVVGRVGPILSDGTSIADLVDMESAVMSLRLFSDPEVYQAELRDLFARTWNVVGHQSEIPNPGDFVRHRIAEGVPAESRSADRFKRPYHGWAYAIPESIVMTTDHSEGLA